MRNRYAAWFRRVVVIGVLVNLALAVPGLFIPNAVIDFVGGTPVVEQVWPSFASLLLILLSLFYLPAALDPFSYRLVAWMAVGARLAGAAFFLGFHREYRGNLTGSGLRARPQRSGGMSHVPLAPSARAAQGEARPGSDPGFGAAGRGGHRRSRVVFPVP
jgi:hypothetical protein